MEEWVDGTSLPCLTHILPPWPLNPLLSLAPPLHLECLCLPWTPPHGCLLHHCLQHHVIFKLNPATTTTYNHHHRFCIALPPNSDYCFYFELLSTNKVSQQQPLLLLVCIASKSCLYDYCCCICIVLHTPIKALWQPLSPQDPITTSLTSTLHCH